MRLFGEEMKHLIELVTAVVMGIPWLAGIVLAHGFWSTAAAVCVPPYAWYLVVERGMLMAGWIGA